MPILCVLKLPDCVHVHKNEKLLKNIRYIDLYPSAQIQTACTPIHFDQLFIFGRRSDLKQKIFQR